MLFLRQYAHLWTCRSLLLRTEEPNAHSLTPPPPQHKCRFQHFHAKTEDFPSRLIQCPSRNPYHPEQQGTYFRGTTDADSCTISRRLCRPPSGRFSFAFLCCVFDGADVLSARLVRELVANRFDQSGDLFSDAMPPTVPQPMPLDLILTTIRNSKAVVVYKGKAQNADVQQVACSNIWYGKYLEDPLGVSGGPNFSTTRAVGDRIDRFGEHGYVRPPSSLPGYRYRYRFRSRSRTRRTSAAAG